MPLSSICLLPSRAVIEVGGDEAQHFLQNLLTCDLEEVDASGAGFGALLTPQGKILFDFLILRTKTGYWLDTPKETVAELLKRLTFYRLRAKVDLTLRPDLAVAASFGGDPLAPAELITITDPRLDALGQRHYGPADSLEGRLGALAPVDPTPQAYARQRIVLGVPESLTDYLYSDIFPHDADMDQLHGVSFKKGCYVGQEVVSRMQHRGTARKRMIQVRAGDPLPAAETPILAGSLAVGTLCSATEAAGIALVRLDKAQAALAAGTALTCGGVPVSLEIPAWAGFTWPQANDTVQDRASLQSSPTVRR